MENLLPFLPNFLLIFCRITSFLVVAPVFSFRGIPAVLKIGLAFYVSLIVLIAIHAATPLDFDGDYLLTAIREILIGLLLGFTAYLLFTVVQIAGSFIDIQIGFGIVNVFDPLTGTQSPIMGNLKFIIATLLFLSINGHHYLLLAIMKSYQWVPLSNPLFEQIYGGSLSDFLIRTFSDAFYIAFQIAAPIVIALFLADVALGIFARVAPQFNMFVVGFPIKIAIGFIVLSIMIPGFLFLFQHLFETMMDQLHQLLEIMGRQRA